MDEREPDAHLPPMLPGQHVVEDYRHLHLSLKAHPVSFLRAELQRRGVVPNAALPGIASGRRVTIGGLVLVRQRPGTAKGVIFATLEDETAGANVIIWPAAYEKFRPVVLGARLIAVTGKVQNASGVIHVVADEIVDLTHLLRLLSAEGAGIDVSAPADEGKRPIRGRHPRAGDAFVTAFREKAALAEELGAGGNAHDVMPKGRNFH
jgi:DNA polymerase III alpha subunit